MSDSTLSTELQIKTTGTTAAINDLRNIARESRDLKNSVVDSGEGFSRLEHVMGKMAGGNREVMMIFRGLGQAAEASEGSLGKFWKMAGNTVMAGGAMAVAIYSWKKFGDEVEGVSKKFERLASSP